MSPHDGFAPGSPLTTREAAEMIDGELRGADDVVLRDVAPIDEAGPDELGLLAMRRYLDNLSETRAAALLVARNLAAAAVERDGGPGVHIVVPDPRRALPVLLRHFHPPRPVEPGVHATAVLGRGVELGEGVTVEAYAVLGEEVVVGDGARVGPHAVVGRGVRVGAGAVLHPHVVVYPGSALGERVVLHAGVAVGVDGFGYVTGEGEHRKTPQVGRCVIEDDVEIGANCTVDRGSIGETVVARGAKLDNLVHVGHNVRIGRGSILVAQVGIAGSSRLGEGVQCGGQSGVAGHLEVGDGARLAARAGVLRNVEPGATVAGFPARDRREFLKGQALVGKLPELRERVRTLESRVDALEGEDEPDA